MYCRVKRASSPIIVALIAYYCRRISTGWDGNISKPIWAPAANNPTRMLIREDGGMCDFELALVLFLILCK
jgi:hypothetical protein